MRLTKSDPTGSYAYLNDGFSPASPVLSDGYSTFTPGISGPVVRNDTSRGTALYAFDERGNVTQHTGPSMVTKSEKVPAALLFRLWPRSV